MNLLCLHGPQHIEGSVIGEDSLVQINNFSPGQNYLPIRSPFCKDLCAGSSARIPAATSS